MGKKVKLFIGNFSLKMGASQNFPEHYIRAPPTPQIPAITPTLAQLFTTKTIHYLLNSNSIQIKEVQQR
jgi:hypothetical protein